MTLMKRRGFLARIGAALVVAAASPTILVAPKQWKRVKAWYNGYLTPKQADRFIEMMLDQSVLTKDARVVHFTSAEALKKIRFGTAQAYVEQKRLGIDTPEDEEIERWLKDGETPPPKMTIERDGDKTILRYAPQPGFDSDGRVIGARLDIVNERPKLTNRELVDKAIVTLDDISGSTKCRHCYHSVPSHLFALHMERYHPGGSGDLRKLGIHIRPMTEDDERKLSGPEDEEV